MQYDIPENNLGIGSNKELFGLPDAERQPKDKRNCREYFGPIESIKDKQSTLIESTASNYMLPSFITSHSHIRDFAQKAKRHMKPPIVIGGQ
jgi:hypothetical protein